MATDSLVLLDAAVEYAAAGIPVVPLHTPTSPDRCSCNRPCPSIGKHPRLMHGLRDASTDLEQVRTWWRIWPQANIGLVTGVVMDVCDVDSEAGLQALLKLLGEQSLTGPAVATGSGGWHSWVRPTGLGNRTGMLPGVDWRGAGGYVVAPPSLHATGRRYRWARPFSAPTPSCPPALYQCAEPPTRQLTLDTATVRDLVREPDRYARAALDAEVGRVRGAREGTRNDTLNRAAYNLGRLVAAGLLGARDVEQALTVAARAVGLGPVEAARTIHSGLTAGARRPRAAS